MSTTRITTRTICKIAAAADCDPRSVRRRARGERGREGVDERIERAAEKLGVKLPKTKDSRASAA